MDKLMRRLWWKGDNENGRYKAWKDWKYLCELKYEGGLGFRDFKCFNKALIAKLGWMIA